ncbi:MAG: error-prone DNA polymerase [Burkholderiales bacterium]|nr:error-prone DNA polymerase [Burkholderiales bacterium]
MVLAGTVCVSYAALQCKSNFSFLEGASHPEELIQAAHELSYRALAVCDECSLAGIVRAHVEAEQKNFHLIIGSQFNVCNDDASPWLRMLLLVKNRTGYAALSTLITHARRRCEKGQYLLKKRDLADALPGVICIVLPQPEDNPTHTSGALEWLKQRYAGRIWIGCSLLRTGFDDSWLDHLRTLGAIHQTPLVATGDVLMHTPERKPLLDLLTAIRLNNPVENVVAHLKPNAENSLRSQTSLEKTYPAELLQASVDIAAQCSFNLKELRYEYPEEIAPPGMKPSDYLTACTWQGAKQRFPGGVPYQVEGQIQHELQLILELQYEAYFLTVHDIVGFARSRGILCQGRGSAANSAVCYCLGITEVDPARMAVLFERFISKERNEPPDIDVDFEHQRREEVIQYIYQKYGRDRAAMTGALMTYHPRSAIRDAGKALGISAEKIDLAAKDHHSWDGKGFSEDRMKAIGLNPELPENHRWRVFSDALIGFPRHLSQLLKELVPIENASMPERSVIQWDKNDLDTLGLLKVDILALGMLSAIRHTLEALRRKPSAPLRVQDIPAEDPATYEMISKADTIGVFQIESRAQMTMLPRLKPREFYDLVIEVAIVRPGPIQGGMVHPYLKRRQGLEPVTYPSEALKMALGRTLGVPIFQEQVMQIAMLAAGFSAGEADELRRAMAAWRRKGGLGPFHQKVIHGMVARGYTQEFAESIFRQIEGFGEYGFPESHAASFALLVYVSCWLKKHHPDAFLVGLLNAQPMGFYAPAQLVEDAKRHGVQVLPVDVCLSEASTVLENTGVNEWAVRLGLHMVAGLSLSGLHNIVEARKQRNFDNSEDLAKRAGLNRSDLQALAAADAMHTLSANRHQAQWDVSGLDTKNDLLAPSRTEETSVSLPEPTEAETVFADYASIGLSLTKHPIALIRHQLPITGVRTANELKYYPDKRPARACGLVTHRQRPGTAKGTVFITLEDETGQVNVIVWPELLERQRDILLNSSVMAVFGIWQKQGEVRHLLAKRVVDLTQLMHALKTQPRNFQ